jgi:CheY-like chemotaxis protein
MRDVLQDPLAKVLIVDDEPLIRTSMSMVLTGIGYSVRSAQDGFSALVEIRKEIPDIILSDPNMPGMSGFELLSVVRRRFPSIRVIAMSGAFSGDEMPSGVEADAFYPKGGGVCSLLKIIRELAEPERLPATQLATSAPLWIERNGHDTSGEPYVSIDCPECLRTFQQTVGGSLSPTREAHCVHCGNTVYFAIVEPGDRSLEHAPQRPYREANLPVNPSCSTEKQGGGAPVLNISERNVLRVLALECRLV